jgi:2,3-bisphosphoglycerate-dependent phosphoglycerate mutase
VTNLILVRHGETDWNLERRWQSDADRPLTARGLEQAEQAAAALRDVEIAAAYASDLQRAWRTAETIVRGRGLGVTRLLELRERSFGAWEGLHDDDVPVLFPDDYARWERGLAPGAPDAEEYDSVVARVETAVRQMCSANPDGAVLVVSHSTPVRVISALADGIDFVANRHAIPEVGHCTPTQVVFSL